MSSSWYLPPAEIPPELAEEMKYNIREEAWTPTGPKPLEGGGGAAH